MMLALYSMACMVIFCSGAYRLHHMDARSTLVSIRLVFWAMTAAAPACAIAGYVWGYAPDLADVLQAWTFAAVQARTAMIWRGGVPDQYRRRRHAGRYLTHS